MKYVLTILKKELKRVFSDPKMIFSLIFPGILIFVMYTFMGEGFIVSDNKDLIVDVTVVASNNDYQMIDDSILKSIENINITKNEVLSEDYQEKIENGDIDLIIYFSNDNFQIFYNPTKEESQEAYSRVSNNISDKINSNTVINIGNNSYNYTDIPFSKTEDSTRQIFAMMLPFLIMTFLFQGAVALGPESIAGEKERGTMATLLATPIKRNYIAMGKITSLSILTIISSLSSFIGIMASMPNLMKAQGDLNMNTVYGFKDYLFILIILITTVLFITGLVSIVSAFAKNVKEAGGYSSIFMFISMGVGIYSMISTHPVDNSVLYLIPLFNSSQVLLGIFSGEFSSINFIITILSNLVFTGLLVYLLTKMFNSEKMMFKK